MDTKEKRVKVQHYKGPHTDINKLYNSIKGGIQDQANLQIVTEFIGDLNNVPLISITTVKGPLKVIAGLPNDIHFSITGKPAEYVMKVGSNGRFFSLLFTRSIDILAGTRLFGKKSNCGWYSGILI